MEPYKNNLCDWCMFACEHKTMLECFSAGNVHPNKLFFRKYKEVAKRGLLNKYKIKSSQISFQERQDSIYKNHVLFVLYCAKRKHEHTCSMVAMSCNFLMKLILWVNFDVTGNQYEQEKVFYHIQMMECSRICKKMECYRNILQWNCW